jgi:hypothetical protein
MTNQLLSCTCIGWVSLCYIVIPIGQENSVTPEAMRAKIIIKVIGCYVN